MNENKMATTQRETIKRMRECENPVVSSLLASLC